MIAVAVDDEAGDFGMAGGVIEGLLRRHHEEGSGEDIGLGGCWGCDCDRNAGIGRFAGAGVDDVMVHAVGAKEDFVVARCRDSSFVERDKAGVIVLVRGILDGDAPALAVERFSGCADFASGVDQIVVNAAVLQQLRDAIGDKSRRDAVERDAHTFRNVETVGGKSEFIGTDSGDDLGDFGFGWLAAGVCAGFEQIDARFDGDVECTIGVAVVSIAGLQHCEQIVVDMIDAAGFVELADR